MAVRPPRRKDDSINGTGRVGAVPNLAAMRRMPRAFRVALRLQRVGRDPSNPAAHRPRVAADGEFGSNGCVYGPVSTSKTAAKSPSVISQSQNISKDAHAAVMLSAP